MVKERRRSERTQFNRTGIVDWKWKNVSDCILADTGDQVRRPTASSSRTTGPKAGFNLSILTESFLPFLSNT